MLEFVSQGAEGVIYKGLFLARPVIVKERISKNYRVRELDSKLNKQRILQEVRCMVKCRRAGVLTPSIYMVELEDYRIVMERIDGITFKEFLWQSGNAPSAVVLVRAIGLAIGKMHDANIIHGDLTTSNIMIQHESAEIEMNDVVAGDEKTETSKALARIVLIDFGLGMTQATVEDKAVDLYVLERAFISTHPDSEILVAAMLESYRFAYRNANNTMNRLEQVRLRGRKRDMCG